MRQSAAQFTLFRDNYILVKHILPKIEANKRSGTNKFVNILGLSKYQMPDNPHSQQI